MRKASPLIILSQSNLVKEPDNQSSWSLYTSKVILILQATPPGANRTLHMASGFLGIYAPLQPVDLIKWKKLDSQNFYESSLTEARFEII